jgi:hypothetical protein
VLANLSVRSTLAKLTEYVVFSPMDPNLPILTFQGVADYWRQFKIGTIHRFELRKGAWASIS